MESEIRQSVRASLAKLQMLVHGADSLLAQRDPGEMDSEVYAHEQQQLIRYELRRILRRMNDNSQGSSTLTLDKYGIKIASKRKGSKSKRGTKNSTKTRRAPRPSVPHVRRLKNAWAASETSKTGSTIAAQPLKTISTAPAPKSQEHYDAVHTPNAHPGRQEQQGEDTKEVQPGASSVSATSVLPQPHLSSAASLSSGVALHRAGPARRAHSASVKMSALALLDRQVHQRALQKIHQRRQTEVEQGSGQSGPPKADGEDRKLQMSTGAVIGRSRSARVVRSASQSSNRGSGSQFPGLTNGAAVGEHSDKAGRKAWKAKRFIANLEEGEPAASTNSKDHILTLYAAKAQVRSMQQVHQIHQTRQTRQAMLKQEEERALARPSQKRSKAKANALVVRQPVIKFTRPQTPRKWRKVKQEQSNGKKEAWSKHKSLKAHTSGDNYSSPTDSGRSNDDGESEPGNNFRDADENSSDEESDDEAMEGVLKFRLQYECRLLRDVMQLQGLRRAPNSSEWDIYWTTSVVSNRIYRRMQPQHRISRFPRIEELTRKDSLFVNIARMQRLHGSRHFDILPETFLLPQEAEKLDSAFHRLQNRSALWIVKPHTSSQGRGIYVTNDLEQIPRNSHVVVSRYISDPYLIQKRKFDIRMYVAITSFDPLRVYVHKEGLVRFATEPYQLSSQTLSNSFMHLTNYAINKRSSHYVSNQNPDKDDLGHKWSISALRRFLRAQGHNDTAVFESIYQVILKAIISVEDQVNAAINRSVRSRNCCFNLLGFDILLDSNLRPWLLEINGSPSLSYDSPLDYFVKGEVVADILTMAALRPPSVSKQPNQQKGKAQRKQQGGGVVNPFSKQALRYRAAAPSYWLRGRNRRDAMQMHMALLRETQDEYERRGGYTRIFPNASGPQMKLFFGITRDLNCFICKKSRNI